MSRSIWSINRQLMIRLGMQQRDIHDQIVALTGGLANPDKRASMSRAERRMATVLVNKFNEISAARSIVTDAVSREDRKKPWWEQIAESKGEIAQ